MTTTVFLRTPRILIRWWNGPDYWSWSAVLFEAFVLWVNSTEDFQLPVHWSKIGPLCVTWRRHTSLVKQRNAKKSGKNFLNLKRYEIYQLARCFVRAPRCAEQQRTPAQCYINHPACQDYNLIVFLLWGFWRHCSTNRTIWMPQDYHNQSIPFFLYI